MREECEQRHVINGSGKCPCDTDHEQRYPVSDWQYEVTNGDTVLGYAEWVEHKIEFEAMWQRFLEKRAKRLGVSLEEAAKPCLKTPPADYNFSDYESVGDEPMPVPDTRRVDTRGKS